MVTVNGERRDDDSTARQLIFDRGNRGVVQLIRIEAKLRAGETLGLDKLEIGVGVLHQHAEPGLPILPLCLKGGGRRNGREDSATGKLHEKTVPRRGRGCKQDRRSTGSYAPRKRIE